MLRALTSWLPSAPDARSLTAPREAAALELDGVSKRFDEVVALEPMTLAVEPGRLTALLGPSGCGKTTTLRIIAGLEAPDSGAVRLAGADVTDWPPNHRRLGMVFQNYSLFPHMTVAENIAFGLEMAGLGQAERGERVRQMLELVRLPGIEERFPRQLSGGQQQRVALARALVTGPQVLLLDEPLGALDRNLRENMQFELRQIQQRLEITTILVTHDQEEALTMSDEVVVMNDGRIVQIGSPSQVYERPRTRFVSEFLGTANLFAGKLLNGNPAGAGVVALDGHAGTTIRVQAGPESRGQDDVLCAVRPEKMWLAAGAAPDQANVLDGQISGHVFRGNYHAYQIRIAGRDAPVVVYQQASDVSVAGVPEPGQWVQVCWKPENTILLEPES